MARKKKAGTRLRITQTRSGIGRPAKHRATLEALGLKNPNDTVIRTDDPSIRGMIFQVQHLVEVEELEGAEE